MPLRRLLGRSAAAAASSLLRRGVSTSTSRPPWSMLYKANLVNSPARRVSFEPTEPPCPSHLVVPAHLVERPRDRDTDSDTERRFFGGIVNATSSDGLILLQFLDLRRMVPIGERPRSASPQTLELTGVLIPDFTHFVCNPISGQLFRIPDDEGTKKTASGTETGILTQSERPHQPPARYAVAALIGAPYGWQGSVDMRRFSSETGEWDTLVGLPSPYPFAWPMHCRDHEVVAFAGRLWWVDVSCGAISADPFSDRPDLHFVELPRGSVTQTEKLRALGRYRRIGVSEGRLRYAEVSQEEPFVLSSFVLDNDGSSWTLEHRMPLSTLWVDGVRSWQGSKPRIGVVDPLNSSVMHITIGTNALAIDMVEEKVLGCSMLDVSDAPKLAICSFLKPSVLPPWLGSIQIPGTSAGGTPSDKGNFRSKTLSDILVRVDRDKKN